MIATQDLADQLAAAAREAAAAILRVVHEGFDVERKGDDSPVTRADRAAEAVILDALRRCAPGVPVIAEEQASAGNIPAHGDTFFLVDPLDGTKEFVRGGDDYTVNIGLIERGVPTLGIIQVPATGQLFAGLEGLGAWRETDGKREATTVRAWPDVPVAVTSKSHLSASTLEYLDAVLPPGFRRTGIGSSLKFCLLAEGRADIYPRLSPTCEWDTAAGHAILLAAGGEVDGPDGRPLSYGKPEYLNPGFLAATRPGHMRIEPYFGSPSA